MGVNLLKDINGIVYGQYEVGVHSMMLTSSKSGDPMVVCCMTILSGKYKGKRIFAYQNVADKKQIESANRFLRSLNSGFEVNFSNYRQYDQLIDNVTSKAKDKQFMINYSELIKHRLIEMELLN
jgi:hypothetical protein